MDKPLSVYVLMSHDQDAGNQICGVFSSHAKAKRKWRSIVPNKKAFEWEWGFKVGHSIKCHKVK